MWNSPDLFPWISDGSKVYDTTIGNNAIAQIGHEDLSTPTDDDYRPISAKHKFTYPYDPSLPAENQRDAAITQAFYIVNMYHDLLYELGFKETDGNFQTNKR
jgi:extracellular elastinolytic metalloproteinase